MVNSILLQHDRFFKILKLVSHTIKDFQFKGQLRPERVEEAIRLSVEKYCSVARMLEKTAEITWDYEIDSQPVPLTNNQQPTTDN